MPSIKQPTGDLYVQPLPSYMIWTASFDLGVSKSAGLPPAPWDLSHMSIFSPKDWNLCVCCSCQHSEESSCSSKWESKELESVIQFSVYSKANDTLYRHHFRMSHLLCWKTQFWPHTPNHTNTPLLAFVWHSGSIRHHADNFLIKWNVL